MRSFAYVLLFISSLATNIDGQQFSATPLGNNFVLDVEAKEVTDNSTLNYGSVYLNLNRSNDNDESLIRFNQSYNEAIQTTPNNLWKLGMLKNEDDFGIYLEDQAQVVNGFVDAMVFDQYHGNVRLGAQLNEPILTKLMVNGTELYGSYGVFAKSQNTGLYGQSISYNELVAGYGVHGKSNLKAGVYGESEDAQGIYGISVNSYGVFGKSTHSYGLFGTSDHSYGIYGSSANSSGIYGTSENSNGVFGTSLNSYGLHGTSANSNGVYGTSMKTHGVKGEPGSDAGSAGILGVAAHINRYGVIAKNSQGIALSAEGNTAISAKGIYYGIEANATSSLPNSVNAAIAANGASCDGIRTYSNSGNGIHARVHATNGLNAGHFTGDVFVSGAFYNPGSDLKLKKNVREVENALGMVISLHPKSYEYKTETYPDMVLPKGLRYGLIAQELEAVLPNLTKEIVHQSAEEDSDSLADRNSVKFKAVNYIELIPILIGAVKELNEKLTLLEMQNEQLLLEVNSNRQ